MTEIQTLYINILLYISLFIYCIVKYKWNNVCSFLSALYLGNSIFGLLLFISPLYFFSESAQGTITIESVLYLFALNTLLILAFKDVSIDNYKIISGYNEKFLTNIQYFLSFILSVVLLIRLPESFDYYHSSEDLADLRNETYGFQDSHRGNFFILILQRLFGSTPILLLTISTVNIILLNKKRFIDKYCIFLYLAYNLNLMLSNISRSVIIFVYFEILTIIILIQSYIENRLRKKIIFYVIALGGIVYPIFSSITQARFSDDESDYIGYSTLRYAGESQLNFCGLLYQDLKEPFYGWNQFPLYRRIVGLDYDNGKAREDEGVTSMFIANKFHYPNPTYIFHGVAGTWFFNWGRVLTPVFFLLFYYLMTRKRKRVSPCISFINILVIIIAGSYVAKGVFYGDYSFESGNLLFFYIFLIWIYLRKYGSSKTIGFNKQNNTIRQSE